MRLPMKIQVPALFLGFVFLFLSCDLGNQPIGSGTNTQSILNTALDTVNGNMRIYADPTTILASNSDEANVVVMVYDVNHNPVAGRAITFGATKGTVRPSTVLTDSSGEARAIFRAEQINTEALVWAEMETEDSVTTVGTYVKMAGIDIAITPNFRDALLNSDIPVTVRLLDGAGQLVSNALVRLTGTVDTIGVTKSGAFSTTARKSSAGAYEISATALGASDVDTVRFWQTLPTGNNDTVRTIRSLRLFTSKSQLDADNSDFASVTAIVTNERNNPLAGDTVRFSTNLGVIDGIGVADSAGRAIVTLRSTPVNGTCMIVAEVAGQTDLRDTVYLLFTGIGLSLSADRTDLSVNDTARVEVLIQDASRNAIGGDPVVFSIISSIGSFLNGAKTATAELDPNGRASVFVTSSTAGTVRVQASGLNQTGIKEIVFSTSNITLSLSKGSMTAGGADSIRVTATYKDNNGTAVANRLIIFASNAGFVTDDSVTTASNGTASTWVRSPNFSGTAVIEARAADRSAGVAKTTMTVVSGAPSSVVLSITPDNISVRGGTARLIAIVKDVNGNMVTATNVNFVLLKGPGGGEAIKFPVAETDNGVAESELAAGSVPSFYRSVEVAAYVGSIADSSKLTISGDPHIVTVSRPQDDTTTVPNGGIMGPSIFSSNVGAVVQDINGNPVADGTPVHFSAVVSGLAVYQKYLQKWAGLGSDDEDKAVLRYGYIDVSFEDVNNNYAMDDNIDLKLDQYDAVARRGDDFNGDGLVNYNPLNDDFFWDFNGNGICDTVKHVIDLGMKNDTTRIVINVFKDTLPIMTDTNTISVANARSWLFPTVTVIQNITQDTALAFSRNDTVSVSLQAFQEIYTVLNDENPDSLIGRTPTDNIIRLPGEAATAYIGMNTGIGEPRIKGDNGSWIYADLNENGVRDNTEYVDYNHNGVNDLPAAFFTTNAHDFRYWMWEMLPFWRLMRFEFHENDFAVVVEASVTTIKGVAETKLTYPRQFARRLFVNVNAEANGVRDKDGERFLLPIIQ